MFKCLTWLSDCCGKQGSPEEKSRIVPKSEISLPNLVGEIMAWETKYNKLAKSYFDLQYGTSTISLNTLTGMVSILYQETKVLEKSIGQFNNNELLTQELKKFDYCNDEEFQWPTQLIDSLQKNLVKLQKVEQVPIVNMSTRDSNIAAELTPRSSTSNTPANISREITPNTTPFKRGNTST